MKKQIRNYYQHVLALVIIVIATTQYEHSRDYVTGRLEYAWEFATMSNKDMKLFTFIIAIGAGLGLLMQKLIDHFRSTGKKGIQLAKEEKQRFIKFGITGGLGLVWKTFILLWLVEVLHVHETLAVIPTFFIISLHNFILNSLWTFKGSVSGRLGYIKYVTANAITGLIYFGVYYSFLLIDQHYLYSSFLGVIAAGFVNFALARYKIWKPI